MPRGSLVFCAFLGGWDGMLHMYMYIMTGRGGGGKIVARGGEGRGANVFL